jgi:hypothetical protein
VNLVLEIGAPLHLFHKIALSLKDSNWRVLATQWKTCLFHGMTGLSFLYLNSGPCSKV